MRPRRSGWWLGLVTAAFLLLAGECLALDPAKTLGQYNCRTWTRQNALPANGVNAITQSNDGYLWLGTAKGLIRFDGVEFTPAALGSIPGVRNTTAKAVAASRAGGVWVGLENSGFVRFDGQAFTGRSRAEWGGENLDVHSILESSDGHLWFTSLGGAARLNPVTEEYQVVLKTSDTVTYNVFGTYEDPQGRMWFGTVDQGIFCWDREALTKLADPALAHVIVFAITMGPDGTLWVGTTVGVFGYDRSLRRTQTVLPAEEVRALLTDREGSVWIGANKGVFRLSGGRLEAMPASAGAAAGGVTALFEDREGSIWIGTREGLSHLTDVKFPTAPAAEDPAVQEVMGVSSSPRGGVWAAHTAGITYYWEGRMKTYGHDAGLPYSVFKRVFEAHNGDVYVIEGTRNLHIMSGGKVVSQLTAPDMLVGWAETPDGIVMSAGGGLYRLTAQGFTPYPFKAGVRPPEMYWILNLLVGHDGALWVGSVNGLFRIKDGEYRRWSQPEGLSDLSVYTLCEDQDNVLWMGTLNGIARLKGDRVQMITSEDGLFDNNIYALVPDDFGNLWFDSGRGIFRARRKDLHAFADGELPRVECTVYDGTESVRPSDKANQERLGARSSDGRIWFATTKGVVVIDPRDVPTNHAAPPVQIERVEADGKLLGAAPAVVPPGRGDLHFQFTALTFVSPQRVRFRYQLEGYDADWIETVNRRFASYTNLQPGTYTFRVTAANVDGVWNAEGATFTVTLRPHFYQAGWFHALCTAAVLALFAGVYLQRVHKLQRRAKELQENRVRLESAVRRRTSELADSNHALKHEVEERKNAEFELKQRTQALEKEIDERKRMQREIERVHRELLEASRQAGMAEVATGVLHNVGNVLNSVNVSAALVIERVQRSKIPSVARLGTLLQEHVDDLAEFLAEDQRGRQIPAYLQTLAAHLETEQRAILEELEALRKNIGHINEIVAMQQNFARVAGVAERVLATELVEDALRINEAALERHRLLVIREYEAKPLLTVERHKVMQILVNLIRNAKYACDEGRETDRQLTLRVSAADARMKIEVIDNGIGIAPDNLTRIFAHGFTTRKHGHGFGLHSSALVAKELGGSLSVTSPGIGHGAVFTLELPVTKDADAPAPKRAAAVVVTPGAN